MFSLDDMFLFAYKLKTCVFTFPLVYMNIVQKRSERKTTSEDREIFYPSDWRVYCCNSSDFLWGAHSLLLN